MALAQFPLFGAYRGTYLGISKATYIKQHLLYYVPYRRDVL